MNPIHMSISSHINNEDKLIYEAIKVWDTHEVLHTFNTGNFVFDWYMAQRKLEDFLREFPLLIKSGSVDHFFIDGAMDTFNLKEAHLSYIKEEERWEYVDAPAPENVYLSIELYLPRDLKVTSKEELDAYYSSLEEVYVQ